MKCTIASLLSPACLLGLTCLAAGLPQGAALANPALPMSLADLLIPSPLLPAPPLAARQIASTEGAATEAAAAEVVLTEAAWTARSLFAGLVPVAFAPPAAGEHARRLDHRRRLARHAGAAGRIEAAVGR